MLVKPILIFKLPSSHYNNPRNKHNYHLNNMSHPNTKTALFRTKECINFQNGLCEFGDKCRFLHKNFSKLENGHHVPSTFRTVPCKYMTNFGHCKNGNECTFLHTNFTIQEDGSHVSNVFRSQTCKQFAVGHCHYGNKCRFNHPDFVLMNDGTHATHEFAQQMIIQHHQYMMAHVHQQQLMACYAYMYHHGSLPQMEDTPTDIPHISIIEQEIMENKSEEQPVEVPEEQSSE
jgi:hypothetical protein